MGGRRIVRFGRESGLPTTGMAIPWHTNNGFAGADARTNEKD